MNFSFSSFALGFVSGYATARLMPQLRPLLVEVLSVVYRVADGVAVQAARRREDLEDLVAEARARARRIRWNGSAVASA